jgi:hypothetical protein
VIAVAAVLAVLLVAVALAIVPAVARRRAGRGFDGSRRILVPFTGEALDERVLAAAIRVSLAERATLVPAYLLVVPLRLPPDAPMEAEVARAMPLLEAVEHAALRAGVPVDARIEKGRTPTHALQQVWNEEPFTRIIAPAPHGRSEGFTPKDMTWILTHAPVETLVLRPTPEPPPPPSRSAAVQARFAARRLEQLDRVS